MRDRVNKRIIIDKDTWDKRIASLIYPGTFCVMIFVFVVFYVYAM